jgi:hypothetical protein
MSSVGCKIDVAKQCCVSHITPLQQYATKWRLTSTISHEYFLKFIHSDIIVYGNESKIARMEDDVGIHKVGTCRHLFCDVWG